MMLLRLLLIATLPSPSPAVFLPGPVRPDGVGAGESIGERQGALRTSRHIKAPLQPRVVNVTRPPTVKTSGTFRVTPRWGKEGLFAFGAGIVYMMDLEVGTPGQEVSVILDTGSYTMLVNPDCGRAADESACETYGHYDTGKSATAQYLNSYFVSQFGTGYMEGVWYNETVYIGQDSLPLPDSRVGVNTWSDYLWAGVLGVSYGIAWNTGYPTLLDLLVSEGYIEVPIFSLGVGYQGGGSSSNIIFGGVDRWKYRGYLEPVEIYPKPATQIQLYDQVGYRVNLTSLGITPPGQAEETFTSSDFARMMLIDTGSTYTYIDADLVAIVAKALNAYIDSRGVYFVPCESRELDGYVNFGFNYGNMIIRASYADFIVDFDDSCALGIQPADAGVATWVLGNSFIRAAYIVFDQQNDAIWLAQYSPCGDNGISDLTLDAGRELWLDMTGLC